MDDKICEHIGGLENNSLTRILATDDVDDESTANLLYHSPYLDDNSLITYLETNINCFTVLSINIASIGSKLDDLNIFVQDLKESALYFSAICIQETWLSDDSDISMLVLNGYNCISSGKRCSTKGGVMIYLHEQFNHRIIDMNNQSDHWDGQFIEVFSNIRLKK